MVLVAFVVFASPEDILAFGIVVLVDVSGNVSGNVLNTVFISILFFYQVNSLTDINISLLLATRGRTDALTRSVRSVFELADQPSQIEMLFAFDREDRKSTRLNSSH